MRRLLYCATVTWCRRTVHVRCIRTDASKRKDRCGEVRSLTAYSAFTAQFSRKPDFGSKSDADMTQNVTIGSIAAKLIVAAGMDAHFVMHEMFVEDLPMYIEALNDKLRHEEESRRLWTFYAVLPHVDSKKLKNPQKLHVFPWEAEEAAVKPGRNSHVASRSFTGL